MIGIWNEMSQDGPKWWSLVTFLQQLFNYQVLREVHRQLPL